jgi:ketosteroid isomerase-like protein
MNAEAEDINERLVVYAGRWNAKDLEALMTLYAQGAVMLSPDRGVALGRAAIRAVLAEGLPRGPVELVFEPLQSAGSGNLAYSTGRYSGVLLEVDGRRVPRHGQYVMIFRRDTSGLWRTVVDAFSTTSD